MTTSILTASESQRLIGFIESIGGGYPLVTLSVLKDTLALLWQYEKGDCIIRCNGKKLRLPRTMYADKTLKLSAPNLEVALGLVRETEMLRQQPNAHPFVRLGMLSVRGFP
jgi:hypothetical protein